MITFHVENVLEATDVTVTVCNASTSGPATRLYDRVKALQYGASSSGTLVNVDATGTVNHPVGSVTMLNHNATTTAILFGSPDYVTWTSVASFNAACTDPYYTTLPAMSTAYLAWRVQFPANITRLKVGELMLGCAQVVSLNPRIGKITEGSKANRRDDESVGGYVRSARLGAARATYDMTWDTLSCGDWDSLSSAWSMSGEGAKPFLVADYTGALRWARFTSNTLDAQRVTSTLRGVRSEVSEQL